MQICTLLILMFPAGSAVSWISQIRLNTKVKKGYTSKVGKRERERECNKYKNDTAFKSQFDDIVVA